MSAGHTVRAAVGVVGELAVTAGVVLVLFVVWQLGYEGVVQGRAQSGVVSGLEQRFGAVPPVPPGPSGGATTPASRATTPTTSTPTATETQPAPGTAFAILRVPRLGGPTWSKPVLEGTGPDVLAQGLGHYPSTALPGQVGNVAIAGHRAGHGNPLIDIDAIRDGDVLLVETQVGYYVYRATGHEIVPPTTVQVLDPVPNQPGVSPTAAVLTLTSCDPRYGSTNRYIVYARLEQTMPRAQGLPAGLLDDPGGA
jgi:sortase A